MVADVLKISFVHRHDIVEIVEIVTRQFAGFVVEFDPVFLRDLPHPAIGQATDVVGSRSRRIAFYLFRQPRFFHQILKNSLGDGGAADVSQTDK